MRKKLISRCTIDLLRNSIYSLKLSFLAPLQQNFSTMCSHMHSKFLSKSAQKIQILSSKASYARGLISFLVMAAVSGCASYRAMPLNSSVCSDLICVQPHFKDVVVAAKAFDPQECKKYLDRNVLKEGYQPIQLTIENKSDKNYILSLSRISLPLANPLAVAESVHTSTIARAAGYGAAALIFWPFAIPAVVDGIRSAKANEALDKDYVFKTVKDHIIAAHSRTNMIMFVPIEYHAPTFDLTLLDWKTNQPREFTVPIR